MTAAAPPAFHHVFGLVVRSALPLPGLIELARAAAEPDVDVVLGDVPAIPDARNGYHSVAQGTLLTVPAVGRYWIEGGRRIVVAPDPDASARNVRVFLLGSALGAVLHQRGLVPLHANAVGIAGQAVAFMGHSGAGKSTLAAWFLDRGRTVLTDDVCVVEHDAAGGPRAHRGLVRLRLWREALERSGRAAEEAARSFDGQDKFDVPMPGGLHAPATLPLGAAVLLERASEDAPPAIERLRGMAAVAVLMENVYRGGYAEEAGRAGALLQACAALAGRVPVLRVRRSWGFDRFDAEAARLESTIGALLRA